MCLTFKGDLVVIFVFLFLSFSVFFFFFFKLKVKVCNNRGSSLPRKTLHLKRLVRSPAFNYLTSHHIMETHICIIMPRSFFVIRIAGSGMCKLTNHSRLGIWEGNLKETGAKPEGEYSAAALDSMRNVMCL